MMFKLPRIISLIPIIISIVLTFSLLSLQKIYADDFSFEYEISNTVTSDLKLTTEYDVTVTNNIGKDFISKTQIIYPFKPDSYKSTNSSGSLNTNSSKNDDGTYTISTEQRPVTGLGAKFSYKLIVQTSEAILKKGNIIDGSIPGLTPSSSIKIKKNTLKISKDLPTLKYISKTINNDDSLNKSEPTYNHYSFSDSNPISFVLGDKSKYSFNISILPKDSIIYFPRSSDKQKFVVSSITIPPTDTLFDNDNNIVLSYDKTDEPVVIKGSIEIQTDKYKADDPKLPTSLEGTYWKSDERLNSIISDVNKQATASAKVKTVFDYLTQNLKYNDKNKLSKRLETSEILDNPVDLHSINITDLAITILRSANVETRMIGGFVDPQVAKEFANTGLHFWLEYYDPVFQGWKEADPTLQILSPTDNFYDGIGLSHVELFKTNSGIKVPLLSSYTIQASLEDGSVVQDEKLEATLITENVQAGKEKSVEIRIQNTGNTISFVKDVVTTIGNDKESTLVNKIIFPNQTINLDAKIKNENYYNDSTVAVNINTNTDTNNFLNVGNLKFSQSNYVLLIVGITSGIIIAIVLGVVIFSIKKQRYQKNILKKSFEEELKLKSKLKPRKF